jgi:predicted DNA binding CopG/RHH family protein
MYYFRLDTGAAAAYSPNVQGRAKQPTKISVNIPKQTLREVKARAAKLDLDVSKYLRALVREDLKNADSK